MAKKIRKGDVVRYLGYECTVVRPMVDGSNGILEFPKNSNYLGWRRDESVTGGYVPAGNDTYHYFTENQVEIVRRAPIEPGELKVGDRVRALEGNFGFKEGEILELTFQDGSKNPWFKLAGTESNTDTGTGGNCHPCRLTRVEIFDEEPEKQDERWTTAMPNDFFEKVRLAEEIAAYAKAGWTPFDSKAHKNVTKPNKTIMSSVREIVSNLFMAEPQKSRFAAGITDREGNPTQEGKDAFIKWLMDRSPEFDTEVVAKVAAEMAKSK